MKFQVFRDQEGLLQAVAKLDVTRAFEETDKRIIEGIATTPTPDRYGDIILAEGAEFSLPLPALWQHSSSEPVGRVVNAVVAKEGIKARIELEKPDAELREKTPSWAEALDKYWQQVKRGLVRGLSIGFRPKPHGYKIDPEDYSFIFEAWEWLELSLVTIPANSECTVQTIRAYTVKQAEQEVRAQATPAGSAANTVRRSTPRRACPAGTVPRSLADES